MKMQVAQRLQVALDAFSELELRGTVSDSSVQVIRVLSGDVNSHVRLEAIRVLCHLELQEDKHRILMATYDPAWFVRNEAISALASFLGNKATRRLEEICRSDSNGINKGVAAVALSDSRGSESQPFLSKLYTETHSLPAKVRILYAIIASGDKSRFLEMLHYLTSNDSYVRELALQAINEEMDIARADEGNLLLVRAKLIAMQENEVIDRIRMSITSILSRLS